MIYWCLLSATYSAEFYLASQEGNIHWQVCCAVICLVILRMKGTRCGLHLLFGQRLRCWSLLFPSWRRVTEKLPRMKSFFFDLKLSFGILKLWVLGSDCLSVCWLVCFFPMWLCLLTRFCGSSTIPLSSLQMFLLSSLWTEPWTLFRCWPIHTTDI